MNDASTRWPSGAAGVPPKIPLPLKRRLSALAVGAGLLGVAAAALFWFNPAQYRFYPFCMFYETTGLLCPGCGGTRALHQLLHGNVAAAFQLNALLVMTLPVLAALGIRYAMNSLRTAKPGRHVSSIWIWCLLALTVGFGVFRNLPAFAWLAP